ncbi:acyltransferase family protein [Gordonia amicalis]|uniref:acyltransferase family protein n=1 Tax=Gordonia amicalis TaxID=89053 RepID=UPI0015F75DF1|nr:acyltransferase family protein [Gordonia amicalis]MBA5847044.1 acyltransferase family protein [Gordonia amicalis]
MSEIASPVSASQHRVLWMDWVRGLCVVLVVLHHVTRQLSTELSGSGIEIVAEAWESIDFVLTPIRIPLFFVVSGVLASSALVGNGTKVARRYVIPLYLYLLWSILLATREVVTLFGNADVSDTTGAIIAELVFVCSGYWYLCALPLYFLVCRMLVRVSGFWVIVIGLLLYVVAQFLRSPINEFVAQFTDQSSLVASVIQNFGFFALGSRFSAFIKQFQRVSQPAGIKVGSLAAYALGILAMYFFPVWPLGLFCSLIGVCLGIVSTQCFVKGGFFTSTVCRIGAQTLPIYVLQFFFISMLSVAWSKFGESLASGPQIIVWFYPAFVTLFIVGLSLAIHAFLLRLGLRVLFVPPDALVSFVAKRFVS